MAALQRMDFKGLSVLHRPASAMPPRAVHLSHATGFNAETYRALLHNAPPQFDFYALDARGHGRTTRPADPGELHSWDVYTGDLAGFLALRQEPWLLMGHSLGAVVSMFAAARMPHLVAGLLLLEPVLLDPRRRWLSRMAQRLGMGDRIPIARAAAKRRRHFGSQQEAVENYAGKGPFQSWPREWIEAYVEGGTRPAEGGGVELSCDPRWETQTFAVTPTDPFRWLHQVQCPITVVTGGQGSTCAPESRAAFMALKPKTKWIHIEEASHSVPMERPELALEELQSLAESL